MDISSCCWFLFSEYRPRDWLENDILCRVERKTLTHQSTTDMPDCS